MREVKDVMVLEKACKPFVGKSDSRGSLSDVSCFNGKLEILMRSSSSGGEIGEPFEETRKVRKGCIFDND